MSTTLTRRGDIRNSDFAYKAKQYSWSKISQLPALQSRRISPTDVDAAIEMNGHFLAFEFKTSGKRIERGQQLFLERWLHRLRAFGAVVICEHPAGMENCDTSIDITAIGLWWWESTKGGVARLNMSPADDTRLDWIVEQWTLHAQGRPNSFVRCCREKLGLYPSSTNHPFARVGGEIAYPPYIVSMPQKQIEIFSK